MELNATENINKLDSLEINSLLEKWGLPNYRTDNNDFDGGNFSGEFDSKLIELGYVRFAVERINSDYDNIEKIKRVYGCLKDSFEKNSKSFEFDFIQEEDFINLVNKIVDNTFGYSKKIAEIQDSIKKEMMFDSKPHFEEVFDNPEYFFKENDIEYRKEVKRVVEESINTNFKEIIGLEQNNKNRMDYK